MTPAGDRPAAIVTGAAGGVFAGLTGVGGGALMIPLMTGFLRLPQRLAHGTSLAILLFVGIAGFIVYTLTEDITWELIPLIASGSVFGAALGARLLARINEQLLRTIFALYLLAIGVRMLLG